MAPRAYWKGYLKLSLVSCSVSLYPATSSSERVRFHTLNRETGHRLRQRMVDEATEEEVPQENRVKGYKVAGDSYVIVEDEELDELEIESTHTIDIDGFVARADIDERYLDSPYYLAPNDKVAQEAFAVIRDAMRERKMGGLARIVLYRRERVVLLEPFEQGILATTLRYPYEVRDAAAYFEDIPKLTIPAEMKDLAVHIIETKQMEFDPAKFEDRYENAVVELVQAKQAGQPVQAARKEPQPSNVVNLMDALRRSVAEAKEPAPARRKKTASRATTGKRKLKKTG